MMSQSQQSNQNPPKKLQKIFHFSWSENLQNDDRKLPDDNIFVGKDIIASLKLDGECTGMTRNVCHARSTDGRDHPSRHWVKALHAQIKYNIPKNYEIFGENVFATHSIPYFDLPTYFFVFLIVDEDNQCLDWDTTEWVAHHLGLKTVPILYDGIWDKELVKKCQKESCPMGWAKEQEGYVVRSLEPFHWNDFQMNYGKFVRKNHVRTNEFWAKHWVPNKLKDKK